LGTRQATFGVYKRSQDYSYHGAPNHSLLLVILHGLQLALCSLQPCVAPAQLQFYEKFTFNLRVPSYMKICLTAQHQNVVRRLIAGSLDTITRRPLSDRARRRSGSLSRGQEERNKRRISMTSLRARATRGCVSLCLYIYAAKRVLGSRDERNESQLCAALQPAHVTPLVDRCFHSRLHDSQNQ
jgi:hypothetical protein